MDQKIINFNESDYFLDYKELVVINPMLKEILKEENSFEFSTHLYEFSKIIYDQFKNEKEEHNSKRF